MRRVAMGVVWFIVLWFGSLILGGMVSAALSSAQAPLPEKPPSTFAEGYAHGSEIGRKAGSEFGVRFGGVILIGALLVSIVGTATGFLPGTKSKKRQEAQRA